MEGVGIGSDEALRAPFCGICTGGREGFFVELTLGTESNALGSESHCRSDS